MVKLQKELGLELDLSGQTNTVDIVDFLLDILALKRGDHRLRWRAARALGETGEPRAVDLLSESTNDEHAVVRWEAAIALGKIGGPRAIESLYRSLDDGSYQVRRRSAQALIMLRGIPPPSPENLDYTVKLLCSGDEALAENVTKAGELAIEYLKEVLDDGSFFVRRDAARALATYIRGLIELRRDGEDLALLLKGHKISPEDIGRLYDLRVKRKKGLIRQLETTDFEMISEKLRGNEIVHLAGGWEPLRTLRRPSSYEESQVDRINLKDLLSEIGVEMPELMGRTLVSETKRGCLAIKLGLKGGDEVKLLWESMIQSHLNRHLDELNLSSRIPRPQAPGGGLSNLFVLYGVPPSVLEKLKIFKDPYAICYLADKSYFRYVNDPRLSPDEVKEGLIRSAEDLASLTGAGLIHTALIPLFHNREQVFTRVDGGVYRWWSRFAGRLDRWMDACKYPNLRLSGLADLEHVEHIPSLSAGDLQHHIGDQILSISLVIGSYFRKRGVFDQEMMAEILAKCFSRYCRRLTSKGSPLDWCIDWDHLARRMREEMEGDRYMKSILRGGGPHGEDVEVTSGPHLGLFNGYFPIPELIRAIHITSLFVVLEMGTSTHIKRHKLPAL